MRGGCCAVFPRAGPWSPALRDCTTLRLRRQSWREGRPERAAAAWPDRSTTGRAGLARQAAPASPPRETHAGSAPALCQRDQGSPCLRYCPPNTGCLCLQMSSVLPGQDPRETCARAPMRVSELHPQTPNCVCPSPVGSWRRPGRPPPSVSAADIPVGSKPVQRDAIPGQTPHPHPAAPPLLSRETETYELPRAASGISGQ